MKAPLVVYADFESLIRKIHGCVKDRPGSNQNRSPRALRLSVRNRDRSGTARKTECTGFGKPSVPRKGDEGRAGRQKAPLDDAGRLASIQQHDRMPRQLRFHRKHKHWLLLVLTVNMLCVFSFVSLVYIVYYSFLIGQLYFVI